MRRTAAPAIRPTRGLTPKPAATKAISASEPSRATVSVLAINRLKW